MKTDGISFRGDAVLFCFWNEKDRPSVPENGTKKTVPPFRSLRSGSA